MVSDIWVTLLLSIACFHLAAAGDPATALSYRESKDRDPTDSSESSWYLIRQPDRQSDAAAVGRYVSDEDKASEQAMAEDKRFSEFLGGRRRRFSEFLGGKKRFSEFLGGRKRFSEFLGGKKRFSEFLGGKRNALNRNRF